MGLNHWVESDNAADFVFMLNRLAGNQEVMPSTKRRDTQSLIEEEMEDGVNEWNTPGYLNIALAMEEEGKMYGEEWTPKFSHLLTLHQLRRISSRLDSLSKNWQEEKYRVKELKKMVDKVIKGREKKRK